MIQYTTDSEFVQACDAYRTFRTTRDSYDYHRFTYFTQSYANTHDARFVDVLQQVKESVLRGEEYEQHKED